MKPVINIMAALVYSVLSSSCEKTHTPPVENVGIPLIVSIKSTTDSSSVEYSYNSFNLLETERSKFYYIRYTYNGENQLTMTEVYYDDNLLSSSWEIVQAANNRTDWVTPENTPRTSYKLYDYDKDGKLFSISNYRKNGYLEYSELSYNNTGSVSRRSYYLENKISAYFDYLYDERENLIRTSRFWVPVSGEATLSYIYEYEYDNKNNPFKAFKRLILPGLNGIYTNENNIIKETYTVVGAFVSSVSSVTEITYEYNDLGYPVKKGSSIVYGYLENI
jgi:hypothetical protein